MMETWQTFLLPLLFGLVVGYSVGKIRALRKIIKNQKEKIESLRGELLVEKLRKEVHVAKGKREI